MNITPETITPDMIGNLASALLNASNEVHMVAIGSIRSEITPEDASTKIREIMAQIQLDAEPESKPFPRYFRNSCGDSFWKATSPVDVFYRSVDEPWGDSVLDLSDILSGLSIKEIEAWEAEP